VDPVRLTHLNERPSAFTAASAPAHAYGVGRVAVIDLPGFRWRLVSAVAFTKQESVRMQDAQVRLQGTNGLTAKAIRMAQSPTVAGVKASGVPPRGRPV
jgi:hypothetical protein